MLDELLGRFAGDRDVEKIVVQGTAAAAILEQAKQGRHDLTLTFGITAASNTGL